MFISVDPERDTVEQVHEYVKGAFKMRVHYLGQASYDELIIII